MKRTSTARSSKSSARPSTATRSSTTSSTSGSSSNGSGRRTRKGSKSAPGKRWAVVRKTRLNEFPDADRFEWSYDGVRERYGVDRLEKQPEQVALAGQEQLDRFRFLLGQLSEGEVKQLKIDRAIATVEDLADLPADRIARGIKLIEDYRSIRLAA